METVIFILKTWAIGLVVFLAWRNSGEFFKLINDSALNNRLKSFLISLIFIVSAAIVPFSIGLIFTN